MWKLAGSLAVVLLFVCVPVMAEQMELYHPGVIGDARSTLIYFPDGHTALGLAPGTVMIDPGCLIGDLYGRPGDDNYMGSAGPRPDYFARLSAIALNYAPAMSLGTGSNVPLDFLKNGGDKLDIDADGNTFDSQYYSVGWVGDPASKGLVLSDNWDEGASHGNFQVGLGLVPVNAATAAILMASGMDRETAIGFSGGYYEGQDPILMLGAILPAGKSRTQLIEEDGLQVLATAEAVERRVPATRPQDLIAGGSGDYNVSDLMIVNADGSIDDGGAFDLPAGQLWAEPMNAEIPEPSTFVLLLMGALGLLWAYRRNG